MYLSPEDINMYLSYAQPHQVTYVPQSFVMFPPKEIVAMMKKKYQHPPQMIIPTSPQLIKSHSTDLNNQNMKDSFYNTSPKMNQSRLSVKDQDQLYPTIYNDKKQQYIDNIYKLYGDKNQNQNFLQEIYQKDLQKMYQNLNSQQLQYQDQLSQSFNSQQDQNQVRQNMNQLISEQDPNNTNQLPQQSQGTQPNQSNSMNQGVSSSNLLNSNKNLNNQTKNDNQIIQPSIQTYNVFKSLVKDQLKLNHAVQQDGTVETYYKILQFCKDNKYNFIDRKFPPGQYQLNGGIQHYIDEWGDEILWMRGSQIYGEQDYDIFQDQIEPTDIKQGELGDCYLLSTIGSIAEWPDRIKKIFVSKKKNDYHCYCLNICDRGILQAVVVDDFVPIDKNKQPKFSRGNGQELWVLLLEKAWAKLYKSYAQIESGLTKETLRDFTCAPAYTLLIEKDIQKNLHIWETILKGEKNNYIMTCGSLDGDDKQNQNGISLGHAYSLLAGILIQNNRNQKIRLVKLRNPWGEGEWIGDWSDKYEGWKTIQQRDKELLQYDGEKNDGVFFMSFEDFCKYFESVQLCHYVDTFVYSCKKVILKKNEGKYFKIQVKQTGLYYFSFSQQSVRHYDEAEQDDFRYSPVIIQIADENFKVYQKVKYSDRDVTIGYQKQQVFKINQILKSVIKKFNIQKVSWFMHDEEFGGLGCYGQDYVEFKQIFNQSQQKSEVSKTEANNFYSQEK